MPMYELSENEIKVVEERRGLAREQSGFRQGIRSVINLIHKTQPKGKEEHQLLMDLVREVNRIEFPEYMRLGAGSDAARVNA